MNQSRTWAIPPARLVLTGEAVHVWRASLNLSELQLQNLWPTLTEDEQARAKRFHFLKDQNHYIAGRGMLRAILSRYLDLLPAQLRFSYSRYGKPTLTEATGGEALRFNVSHSHGMALYAVTRNRDVGIDLELMRADFAGREIAERFFSQHENEELLTLPAEAHCEAFFNCWTRKEAYIKARGEGLSIHLDQFDVSLSPSEPARLLNVRVADKDDALDWRMETLEVAPNYAAALVVRGEFGEMRCWEWRE
jgi:4'-phosphopantetheinyl transferase